MVSLEKQIFSQSSRIVIKIGSSLVSKTKGGLINKTILNNIVEEIKRLKKNKKEVMVVSSGALALGRKVLNIKEKKLKIAEKQAAAAVGQIILVNAWKEIFFKYKLNCGQVLLTHSDAENRRSSLNARNTLETLIKLDSIPIINENDTITTEELKYGDNDQLAARVAQISSADLLVLLSDVKGLYSSNPINNPKAKLINRIYKITKSIEKVSKNTVSPVAVGGMSTKIKAAKIAMATGCHMVITKGSTKNPIKNLLKEKSSTWFISETNPKNARKKWISSQLFIKGSLFIDEGAEKALRKEASLLPAGIISVKGNFEKGDIINIINKNNLVVCVGISSYPSEDAKRIAGFKSNEITKLLGYHAKDVVVHRDDLVLKND